jgi:hypothetical protein
MIDTVPFGIYYLVQQGTFYVDGKGEIILTNRIQFLIIVGSLMLGKTVKGK